MAPIRGGNIPKGCLWQIPALLEGHQRIPNDSRFCLIMLCFRFLINSSDQTADCPKDSFGEDWQTAD